MDFSEISLREALEQVLDTQNGEVLKNRINATLSLIVAGCDEENSEWVDFLYRSQELHLNPYNGVHGGIACTLADTCMGMTLCAATQALPSTTDMSVSYLNPMPAGEYIIRVYIKKIGKQLAAATCEIRSLESGKLCVTSMGKYTLVRKDILADERASMLLKEQNK